MGYPKKIYSVTTLISVWMCVADSAMFFLQSTAVTQLSASSFENLHAGCKRRLWQPTNPSIHKMWKGVYVHLSTWTLTCSFIDVRGLGQILHAAFSCDRQVLGGPCDPWGQGWQNAWNKHKKEKKKLCTTVYESDLSAIHKASALYQALWRKFSISVIRCK